MNTERLHKTFLKLVEIESPSYDERAMADWCTRELEALGFSVVEDGAGAVVGSNSGNLLATLPGTTEGALVLSAHMDTVKPCTGIEVHTTPHPNGPEHGDVYCSVGETILSADDKAGIAAIFEAVRSVVESGAPRPTIHILLTICEEQSLLGSGALDPALVKERIGQGVHGFVFDADGVPGTIISGAPCHRTMRAAFEGRAAHAGVEPEAGISAIEMAAAAIAAMPLGRLDEATTANVGIIEGGVATNVVAAQCRIEGECRSLYADRADAQQAAMTHACEEAAAQAGGSVAVDWTFDYPEILLEETDSLIVRLTGAIESAGLTPIMHHTGGGSDANVLGEKGIHAVCLGIGMTNFHSTEEFISYRDLENAAHLAESLIYTYAK